MPLKEFWVEHDYRQRRYFFMLNAKCIYFRYFEQMSFFPQFVYSTKQLIKLIDYSNNQLIMIKSMNHFSPSFLN